VGCDTLKDRNEMIRIMKLYSTGEVIFNPNSKHFGRSSYVCYNIECINKALKKKRLQKTLKSEVPANIIEFLEKKEQ